MMKKLTLVLFTVCLLFSCGSNDTPERIELSPSVAMDASRMEEIEIPPVLYKERVLVATDNFLFFAGATPDTLFRVFDRITLEYLGGFGKKGDGPDDYRLSPSTIRKVGGDIIQVGELGLIKELEFTRLPEKKEGFSVEVIKSVTLPEGAVPLSFAFQLNDSTYAGTTSFGAVSELLTVNIATESIDSIVPYPNYVPHIPYSYGSLLYQRVSRYSSAQNKLASVYSLLPALRIYDFDTDKAIDIHIKPELEQLPFREEGDGMNLNLYDKYRYYQRVQVSDNYLYALYQIYATAGKEVIPLSFKELHVFDFEGNFVYSLRLEEWMSLFAIAPEDKSIYFWHPEEEDRLYRYNLEGLF